MSRGAAQRQSLRRCALPRRLHRRRLRYHGRLCRASEGPASVDADLGSRRMQPSAHGATFLPRETTWLRRACRHPEPACSRQGDARGMRRRSGRRQMQNYVVLTVQRCIHAQRGHGLLARRPHRITLTSILTARATGAWRLRPSVRRAACSGTCATAPSMARYLARRRG